MEDLFEVLHAARNAAKIANDQKGQSPFFQLGLVTENRDPLNKRRIKVTLQSKGGKTQTDWLFRLVASPYDDPPLPRIGQTVGVLFIDGDPHNGVYFGALTNQTNVERELSKPVEDDGRLIEGEQIETIESNRVISVEEDDTLNVSENRTTTIGQNDLLTVNGTLTINADGSITIEGATMQITASRIDLN